MSNFLSILGWAFLPSLVASWAQTIYYGLTIRAGDPKPAPSSARFKSHRRVIYILVVALYLAYTIYEADHEIRSASSFYADLGVSPSAAEREIKSHFRRLAALHHPDKAGSNDARSADAAAAYFMHLKTASETLQDAARRFAYERFGPDIVRWQRCKSIRDFVNQGVIQAIIPHYTVAAATIYILGLFGYMDFGRYYRWLILVSLLVLELHAVTRPYFPPFLDLVNTVVTSVSSRPPYLPFQIITLARKLSISVYIALSQIGPVLATHLRGEQAPETGDDEKSLRQGLDRLEAVAAHLYNDAARLMDMETAPFKGDSEAAANLQGKMREWLVQNTIRADPMVRDALGSSFKRRRIDAPSGARGNR